MLYRLIETTEVYQKFARRRLTPGAPARVAVPDPFLAAGWVAALAARQPVCLVVPDAAAADRLAGFLAAWGAAVTLLPAEETLPFEPALPAPAALAARATAVAAWRAAPAGVLVVPPAALAAAFPSGGAAAPLELRPGLTVDRDRLRAELIARGYREVPAVKDPGDYAVRGGLVDLFPGGAELPSRLDFLGDRLEDLRVFDPGSQLSLRAAETVALPPLRPLLLTAEVRDRLALALRRHPENAVGPLKESLALGDPHPHLYLLDAELGLAAPFPSFLPAGAITVFFQPELVAAAGVEYQRQLGAAAAALPYPPALTARLARHYPPLPDQHHALRSGLAVELSGRVERGQYFEFAGKVFPEYLRTGAAPFPAELVARLAQWPRSVCFVPPGGNRPHLAETLRAAGLTVHLELPADPAAAAGCCLLERTLPASVAVLAEPARCFFYHLKPAGAAAARTVRPWRYADDSAPLTALFELSAGDHVIHLEFGIGQYRGLERLTAAGLEGDYLKVAYAGDDVLYVPVDKLHLLHKYVGGAAAPALGRLRAGNWDAVARRIKASVREMAADLLRVQALRHSRPGHAFPPDTPEMLEFEQGFPFTATYDQARAIAAVKADLERPSPMDRLVCGDVGYGKTEVALRAAFKVAGSGMQVALLCPTTLLAQQHYTTFRDRFRGFPHTVELLSRFRTEPEQRATVERARRGEVDVLIGTHRLFSDDVGFLDLGLVIIDEEQRFGVRHKEKLKSLRNLVDVLTLTATPIPRTLHLAFSGLRDISVIETAPPDKKAVQTHIGPRDPGLERDAIRRELARGGQVFYVHNRVATIARVAHDLRQAHPGARLAIAHGRMGPEELEAVMGRFVEGEYDLLVTTAIIESGLDLPNVNTLIVSDAHRFGLADLYQLRGRVGRVGRQAYAYFFYPPAAAMTGPAQERLDALATFTDLGAGFQLAVKDLEIRGAGNLLGPEQHGMILAVGLPLYSQLLEEAIGYLHGETQRGAVPVNITIPLAAFLPEAYVPPEKLRLKLYKRLAQAAGRDELAALEAEVRDRFGPLPEPAAVLFALAAVRQRAEAFGIVEIGLAGTMINCRFGKAMEFEPGRLQPHGWRIGPPNPASLRLPLPAKTGRELLAHLEAKLGQLAGSVARP